MFKMQVVYESIDGEQVTEDVYFNLSKMECLNLEANTPGGLAKKFQEIIDNDNPAELLSTFEWFVGLCYGVRSEDGTRFMKKDENGNPLFDTFKETLCYDQCLFDLATDANTASAFVAGALPEEEFKKLAANAASQNAAASA